MSCEKRFHEELRRRGLRVTPQREAILTAIHDFDRSMSAEELHRGACNLRSGIKLSTVYRTLDLLQSLGLVSVVEADGRGKRYMHETSERPHFHLVCRHCGEVSSVDYSEIKELASQLNSRRGFQLDETQVSLPGICSKCR